MCIPLILSRKPCCCLDCLYLQTPTSVRPGKCSLNLDCFSKKCADCLHYPLMCSNKITITKIQDKEILNKMKQDLEKLVGEHTFHFPMQKDFDVSTMYPLKQIERYPSSKETYEYLISRIHWNMLGKDITTQQYRSLKGEIRKGNTVGPIHFIRKFVSGQECLRETLDFMVRKKHLGVGEIPVNFTTPVKTAIIDIEISMEGDKDDEI